MADKKTTRTSGGARKVAKAGAGKSGRAKKVTVVPDEAQVRQRAYEIYRSRGGEPGHELEDWLQAERELSHK